MATVYSGEAPAIGCSWRVSVLTDLDRSWQDDSEWFSGNSFMYATCGSQQLGSSSKKRDTAIHLWSFGMWPWNMLLLQKPGMSPLRKSVRHPAVILATEVAGSWRCWGWWIAAAQNWMKGTVANPMIFDSAKNRLRKWAVGLSLRVAMFPVRLSNYSSSTLHVQSTVSAGCSVVLFWNYI